MPKRLAFEMTWPQTAPLASVGRRALSLLFVSRVYAHFASCSLGSNHLQDCGNYMYSIN
jgi:hypothetical protein